MSALSGSPNSERRYVSLSPERLANAVFALQTSAILASFLGAPRALPMIFLLLSFPALSALALRLFSENALRSTLLRPTGGVFPALLVFCGWAGLSGFWGGVGDFGGTAKAVAEPLLLCGLFGAGAVLSAPWVTKACLRWVAAAWGVAIGLSALLALAGFFFAGISDDGRLIAVIGVGHPVVDGAIWGVTGVLALAAKLGSGSRKLLWRVLGVLLIVTAVQTQSRSVIVCVFSAAAALAWFDWRRGAMLFFTLAFAAVLGWATPALGLRGGDQSVGTARMQSAGAPRLAIWRNSVLRAGSSTGQLLFGQGRGQQITVAGPEGWKRNDGGTNFFHPHSLYLTVLLRYGLIGLIILSLVIICAIWKLLNAIGVEEAQMASLISVYGLVYCLFDVPDMFGLTNVYTYFVFAALVSSLWVIPHNSLSPE